MCEAESEEESDIEEGAGTLPFHVKLHKTAVVCLHLLMYLNIYIDTCEVFCRQAMEITSLFRFTNFFNSMLLSRIHV